MILRAFVPYDICHYRVLHSCRSCHSCILRLSHPKHTHKTDDLEKEVERRKNELITAYRQVAGYYQLEEKYSEQIATMTGQAQRTVKSQFRDGVQQEGFDRPKWTTLECEKAIDDLKA
jgi:hypothetical protein